MNCKCCGAWFSSSDASQELCAACRRALARVSKLVNGIEPVRHGKPVNHYTTYCNSDGKPVTSVWDGYECPFCGSANAENYCPRCGAKMDLEVV